MNDKIALFSIMGISEGKSFRHLKKREPYDFCK